MKSLASPLFSHSHAELDAGSARSSWRAWIPGVVAVGLLALPMAWLSSQVAMADDLLGGLGALRSAVRAGYTSAQGYGADGSPPRFERGTAPVLQTQWQDLGGGMLRGPSGLRLQVTSRMRTFEVRASGVSPLACRLALTALESGWSEVRVNGRTTGVPTGGALSGAACGWLGAATLGLTSAG